jgi:hypothetical protein
MNHLYDDDDDDDDDDDYDDQCTQQIMSDLC